jgi:hypothetical protein
VKGAERSDAECHVPIKCCQSFLHLHSSGLERIADSGAGEADILTDQARLRPNETRMPSATAVLGSGVVKLGVAKCVRLQSLSIDWESMDKGSLE